MDYEKLSNVTVTLCRLDLYNPKQLNLNINLMSNPPLHCLQEKVDLVEIPVSDEVKWEFYVLNAGKVSSLLDSSLFSILLSCEITSRWGAGVDWGSCLW